MEERRRFLRKLAQLKIICQAIEEPWVKISGICLNISQGGLVLKIKKYFKGYKRLNLVIPSLFNGEPLRIKGRVSWESEITGTDEKKGGHRVYRCLLEPDKRSREGAIGRCKMRGVIKD